MNIEHYRFRIVRRGWVRGDRARRVLEGVRQRMPGALAERIAEVWPIEGGGEVVRLRIRATLDQLAAACASDEAMARFAASAIPGSARSTDSADVEAAVEPAVDAAARAAVHSPLVWLIERHTRGELIAVLEEVPASALFEWEAAVMREVAVIGARSIITPDDVAIVRAIAVEVAPQIGTTRARIAAVIAIAARPIAMLRDELVREVIAHELPDVPAGDPPRGRAPETPAQPRSSRAELRRPERSPRTPSIDLEREAGPQELASVLPFLLVRSLARIGYLDALAASFAAVHRFEALPAFATGLAYKVLDPAERGWRRTAATVATASAFAGSPVADSELAALASDAARLAPPLDGVIARALLAGHDPARPLLVVAHAGTRWIVEPDGLFPIGHDLAVLRSSAQVLALDAADADFVRAINAAGLRFVTSAPPTRGEPWRRLRYRDPLWTNDSTTPDHRLARDAKVLERADDALAVFTAFAARPALPRDDDGIFDRSLALAAGAALGDLAYTLWHEREPTSPLLALLRFGDLSGSLRDGRVRLPLGARRRDLERIGVLGEIRVPWLATPVRVG